MEDVSIIEEQLKNYKYLHSVFYEQYVNSGYYYRDRDIKALAYAYEAKALYRKWKIKMCNPIMLIHPN